MEKLEKKFENLLFETKNAELAGTWVELKGKLHEMMANAIAVMEFQDKEITRLKEQK